MSVTRRELLLYVGALTAQASFGCSSSGKGTASAETSFFTAEERRALGALANAVLPPDDTPGGEALGAVPYIERLMTALDGDTPQLIAGGPYSGRAPFADGTRPPNDFATWERLDRVTYAAWRLALYGSKGVPGGGPNDRVTGPVVGLRDRLKDGLKSAMAASPAPLETLDPTALRDAFKALDVDFQAFLVDLVTQAAFSAPEYGGNPDLAGWKLVHYEGDAQPLGYSIFDEKSGAYRERPEAPMSGPNPGADPEPLGDEVRAFLDKLVALTGGRTFP